MKFESKDGSAFEMAIHDYEFPKSLDSANWLLMNYSITNSIGTWTSIEPCMETFDIAELINWLDEIAVDGEYQDKMHFDEPAIRFHRTQNDIGEEVLRVFVDSNYSKFHSRVELRVDFLLEEINFKGAAENLRLQLAKFPERPDRDMDE